MTESAGTVKTAQGAKERSPNYPSIGIGEAVDLARKLWDREKRTAVPSETAVKAWGYSGLSGASRTLIGALRQYGLLENAQEGVKLSELAIEILHQPDGSEERTVALSKAAMNPPLIKALAETHSEASDDALRAYLITRRAFSEDGAKRLIKSFREALTLARPEASGYNGAGAAQGMAPDAPPAPDGAPTRQHQGRPKVTVLSFPLSKTLTAEVRFTGDELQPAHIDRLVKHLELAKDAVGSDDES